MKPRIAVLASGSGTTTEAFVRSSYQGKINTDVAVVIVSREDAGIFKRIEKLNSQLDLDIKTRLINSQTHPAAANEKLSRGRQSLAEQQAIKDCIEEADVELIVLMGYMKRIGSELIEAYGWLPSYTSLYQGQMVNTHPGLLPDTKGMYGQQIQEYVLEHKLPYGGQSLHLVSEDYDDGPIIAEHRVPVEPGDDPETLFARVQTIEKQYLPGDIEAFIEARLAYTKT
jgi:phosphoribosylglycinamide formyltransferase-1